VPGETLRLAPVECFVHASTHCAVTPPSQYSFSSDYLAPLRRRTEN